MTSGATARDDAVSVERQQQRAYLPHRASLVHYKVNTTTNTNVDGNKPSSRQKKKRDDTEVAEDDDDFMMRIVHGSCQGVFRGGDGSLCQIPSCQMPEHLDLLMHCRQPLSFLSFFREPCEDNSDEAVALPAGAYMMPMGCEYCGAQDTHLCDAATCTRPGFYFQKKKPPFCRPDARYWDLVSEHAVVNAPPAVECLGPPPSPPPRSPSSPFEGSWVSGLFGNNRRGNSPTPTT